MFITAVNFTHAMFFDSLLTIAYPTSCSICERGVDSRHYGPVCDECWRATKVFDGTENVCWKCGVQAGEVRQSINSESISCNRCSTLMFEAARACGVYGGALRASVLELKRTPVIAPFLTTLIVETARRAPLDKSTRIVPVPLHPDRLRQRGFNQASIIARALSPKLKLVIDETSLIRINSSQKYRAGLDSKGRRDSVARAFYVIQPRVIAGENVLLVDDVFTTGSTVSNCASALLDAGASKVFVLTIARPGW